ncbi:hypothetical protein TNCV_1179681 [Trichonephila clavipes]|nr:hypothetical protein TNCV_1179681 [Trichonephila clavipes]
MSSENVSRNVHDICEIIISLLSVTQPKKQELCDSLAVTDSRLAYHDFEFTAVGNGGRVVKISNCGWPCHEFESSTTKDPPCRAAMYVKSVESSNAPSPVGVAW